MSPAFRLSAGSGGLEWPQELAQHILVFRFGDHHQRVRGQHRFAADAHAVARGVRLAEMVEQPGASREVSGRAAVSEMLVAHDEDAHAAAHAW